MADPSEESSGKNHRFLFHLWLILKPRQRGVARKKTSFLRQLHFFFKRSHVSSEHNPESGNRLKKIKHLWRKPRADKALQSVHRFCGAIVRSLNFTQRPAAPKQPTPSYSPFLMSLKHAAETGKRGLNEDWELLKTFFRMAFRLPQKPESGLPKFTGIKLLPGKTQDPVPRTHGFTLFFREPREAFFSTGKQLTRLFGSFVSHWQQIAVVSIVFVCSLELSLQIVSTATWLILRRIDQARPTTNESLLFLGDFFTSGEFGARDVKPYTEYLPQYLAKKNLSRWNVVSYSAQHADVSNLLEVLPALILRERPRIVYIMVGAEDLLSGPVPRDLRQQEKQIKRVAGKDLFMIPVFFRKWNQERSFGAILDSFTFPSFFARRFIEHDDVTTESLQSELKSLLQPKGNLVLPNGELFYQGQPVTISNNRFRLPDNTNWICFAAERYCERESSSNEIRSLEVDGPDLIWNGSTLAETFVLTQNPGKTEPHRIRAGQILAAAWDDINAGAYESARQELNESIAIYPDDPVAHAGLSEAFYNLGNFGGVNREIGWLERKYKTEPGSVVARALARSYSFQHYDKEEINSVLQMLKSHPENAWLWSHLAESLSAVNADAEAGACIRKALILTPKQMTSVRAAFFRIQANILARTDPQESLFCLLQAFVLDRDMDAYTKALRAHAEQFQTVNVTDTMKRLELSQENKRDLSFAFRRAVQGPSVARIALFQHKLSALLNICRISGVEPVLVTYPISQSRIYEVTRTIAEQDGVAWLNLNSQFEILLAKENKNLQILRYGILTDEGSRRIAEMMTADVSARVTAHQQ